jgi:hypothetical protein
MAHMALPERNTLSYSGKLKPKIKIPIKKNANHQKMNV